MLIEIFGEGYWKAKWNLWEKYCEALYFPGLWLRTPLAETQEKIHPSMDASGMVLIEGMDHENIASFCLL